MSSGRLVVAVPMGAAGKCGRLRRMSTTLVATTATAAVAHTMRRTVGDHMGAIMAPGGNLAVAELQGRGRHPLDVDPARWGRDAEPGSQTSAGVVRSGFLRDEPGKPTALPNRR